MYDETEFSDKAISSSATLQQLNETLLFIDAEITVVDLTNMKIFEGIKVQIEIFLWNCLFFLDLSVQIPLLDVYNNGYHIGGKLNVTLDRFFTMNSMLDGSGHLSQSRLSVKHKYENRINMSDVTLRVGTVVWI